VRKIPPPRAEQASGRARTHFPFLSSSRAGSARRPRREPNRRPGELGPIFRFFLN